MVRAHLEFGDDAALPLHAKLVPRVSWDKVDKFVREIGVAIGEYEYAKKWIFDPITIGLTDVRRTWIHEPPRDADILPTDLSLLLRLGYVRALLPHERPQGIVQLFTTKEKLKLVQGRWQFTRRRLITVPWAINDANLTVADTQLPGIEEITAALDCQGAATFDIEAFYVHLPLPQEIQLHYCFTFDANFYCLLTVPTGSRHCPALAQAISRSVAQVVGQHSQVQALAYLDNFRFAGSDVGVYHASRIFGDIMAELNLQWSCEEKFADEYVFLGICCDHKNQTTKATPKALEKLRINASSAALQEATLRTGLRLLGSLMWISSVCEVQLAHHYIPLKFFRRRCASGSGLRDPLEIWNCAKAPLQDWINACLANRPRAWRNPPAEHQAVLW
ncbi:hypothetical protein K2X33_09360, partial [bacterium]|nr:hypothetical protein [bacterium]